MIATELLEARPGAINASELESRLSALESRVDAVARSRQRGLNIVAFSGDMDKVMTAFIIANGAAALELPVTIFFTFWALAALRKGSSVGGKTFLDRVISGVLPASSDRLGLSRWNMFGLGRPFINWVMKTRNVESLENLIQMAPEMGVRLIACQMSMEMLGLTAEELIEGVELGGLTTFLDASQESATTLFV